MKHNIINFDFEDKSMEIFIDDNCMKEISKKIKSISSCVMYVIDENVFNIHNSLITSLLNNELESSYILVKAEEKYKNINTLQYIMDKAIENNLSRKDAIVAIGGGLVGNVSGMAAGLLYRGIKLVHIPTTLLAMSDSILSLKQAINGKKSKNIYGIFHVPEFCGIDTIFLKTIPAEQLICGFIELCKNALIFDTQYISECIKLSEKIKLSISSMSEPLILSDKDYQAMIIMGINSKQKLLRKDKYEKNGALILEYGHTVGHALELESDGKIPHGIAVGVGMLVAAIISYNRGWISQNDINIHLSLLKNCSSLTKIPQEISINGVISRIKKDNKIGYLKLPKDEYAFILLKSIGVAEYTNNLPLCGVHENELKDAISHLNNLD